jgi:hypothetical protein
MYDMPYRLEQDGHQMDGKPRWVIMRTGEGEICRGTNFTDMRRLVDAANEQTLSQDRHR